MKGKIIAVDLKTLDQNRNTEFTKLMSFLFSISKLQTSTYKK